MTSSPMVYLLNSPILTAYGEWRFSGPVDLAQARSLLSGGFTSAIGHAGSAEFLSALLGIHVPVNRVAVAMQPGDRALVLRLRGRLPEGAILSHAEVAAIPHEFGELVRMA